jgi:putative methyltransferase
MSKKNVYLSQYNTATERNLIPLAIGLLTSYIKDNKLVQDNFDIDLHILREDPKKIIDSYDNPYLLGYSNYFWNFHYTIEVAKLAKKKFQNAIVVFGGPSVPVEEYAVREFFLKYPFVNIIVAGEGEIVFKDILETLAKNESLEKIDGISLNLDNKITYKEKRKPINDFLGMPSPFLDGTFDDILKRYPNDITGVVWESNRGCPYSCSFCYWGGPEKRITDFSDERVYKELDWISKNKINYIFGADANFGIRQRDEDIAKYIAKLNIETGYPKFFVINWNKNSTDKIFNIVDALNESEVSFMLTVSVQSFYDPTLDAIKRKNIKMKHFNNILAEANKRNFNTYTEIILGLPLETYETFKNGIGKVIVSNLNYHFNLYPCVMITGTEMSTPEYIEKYGIQTRTCEINLAKTATVDNGFKEYEDIIVGTSTMNNNDWQKSFLIGFLIKAFYGFRLTYFVFNYLRDKYDIDLIELYEFIIENSSLDLTILNDCIEIVNKISTSILNNGKGTIKIKNIDTELYPEMAVVITVLNNKEIFYDNLKDIINRYIEEKNIQIDVQVLDQLFVYQLNIIPSFKDLEDKNTRFDSKDIREYFNIEGEKTIFRDKFYTDDIDKFLANHIYGGMVFQLNQVLKGT